MRQQVVFEQLNLLNDQEEQRLSSLATKSATGTRRVADKNTGYRQNFAVDADRILHTKAYTRYIDKTQVFSLITNDHISHRVLHVQLVSRIARTIGRFLFLNEDLIEAIALGHDIGHPPFGHEGEVFLATLCKEAGIGSFYHNLQSVRILESIEKNNKGCNLCLQTLDGILCHDGESRIQRLTPTPISSFDELAEKKKLVAQGKIVSPSSLEACVVRIADTIAYLGRDIEDAITLGFIERSQIPEGCREFLGDSNGTIVYNLVTDLLNNSSVPKPDEDAKLGFIDFSEQGNEILHELKKFNYTRIYKAPAIKRDMPLVEDCYKTLFSHYVDALTKGTISPHDLGGRDEQIPAAITRDFIAGMTDDYFLQEAAKRGCITPEKQDKL